MKEKKCIQTKASSKLAALRMNINLKNQSDYETSIQNYYYCFLMST